MAIACFLCKNFFPVENSKKHFAFCHNFEFQNGDCKNNFLCVNDNCNSSFTSYKTFRKHYINKHHDLQNLQNQEIPENIEVFEDIEQNTDDSMDNSNELQVIDLAHHIRNDVLKLRSESSMTHADFKFFIETVASMFEYVLGHFKVPIFDINSIKKVFSELKTFNGQKKLQKNSIHSAEPKEITLGYRNEVRLKDGESVLMRIPERFSYIPITNTLINIISNKNLRNLIENEKQDPNVESNTVASFTDTNNFKTHPFLQKYPKTIRISLYYDGVEMVNSIGSKTGIHSVGIFYFSIQNFPMQFSTHLKNIYTLLTCYNVYLKKYGFKTVLRSLIDELKILETDDGINVKFSDGTDYTLRAILSVFVGDALAVSEIFELLSPATNHFCRECLCSRDDLKNFSHTGKILRSKELHNEHLHKILNGSSQPQDYGISDNSILNELTYFHSTENFSYDLMHDLWEGVLPMEIKYVLRYFVIEKKYFDINTLNQRVNNFRYGPLESKNKPSPNFTYAMLYKMNSKTIRQKAVQCWLLLRVFSFLFAHFIPQESQLYMDLMNLLLKIVQIVNSTQITEYMLCELDRCINLHEELFHRLFPNVTLINKHHHLRHYVNFIKSKGPMVLYSCVKYEAKHFAIKKKVMQSGNFKNVPKSIISSQSYIQNENIAHQIYLDPNIVIKKSKIIKIEDCLSEIFIKNLTNSKNFEKVSNMTINDLLYKKNIYIMYNNTEDILTLYPSFLKILEIIRIEEIDVYFYCYNYKTVSFSDNLNSFEILQVIEEFKMISIKNVIRPVSVWHTYDEPEKKYVCLKEHF